MVAGHESAELAERLIADSAAKEHIAPGTLTLHADRGSSMRSKPVAKLLSDLGIAKSHSRPYVSDDNPYSSGNPRERLLAHPEPLQESHAAAAETANGSLDQPANHGEKSRLNNEI
jgi:transposase InsO family protein